MKPFSLEAAQRGDIVCLKSGTPIHFVGLSKDGFPVVEWNGTPSVMRPDDLFMAPKKRTVYVNLYDKTMRVDAAWHHTEANALEASSMWTGNILARAVPIEIEE